MMLLLPVVLLGLGYALYRNFSGSQDPDRDRVLEELRTAYPRGDMSDEEFERWQQRLRRDEE